MQFLLLLLFICLFECISPTEMQLLDVFKNVTSKNKNSVLQNAIVISHAYMNAGKATLVMILGLEFNLPHVRYAGTTSDVFLRNNIDWLGQANHYARFKTNACLDVVHKGHTQDSLSSTKKFPDPYLPKVSSPRPKRGGNSNTGSPRKLIHPVYRMHARRLAKLRNRTPKEARYLRSDSETVVYLQEQLQGNASHVVKHGACLGLGFAAMAAGTETLDASDKAFWKP